MLKGIEVATMNPFLTSRRGLSIVEAEVSTLTMSMKRGQMWSR